MSTLKQEIAETYGNAGWAYKSVEAQAKTLTTVWSQEIGTSRLVHFLKVDAEGNEEAFVRAHDWDKFRPWIVVIKTTLSIRRKENHSESEKILLQVDYLLAFCEGLNRFYVAKEHSRLLAAFSAPPNVFDDLVLAEYVDPLAQLQFELNEQLQEKRWPRTDLR